MKKKIFFFFVKLNFFFFYPVKILGGFDSMILEVGSIDKVKNNE